MRLILAKGIWREISWFILIFLQCSLYAQFSSLINQSKRSNPKKVFTLLINWLFCARVYLMQLQKSRFTTDYAFVADNSRK